MRVGKSLKMVARTRGCYRVLRCTFYTWHMVTRGRGEKFDARVGLLQCGGDPVWG